MTSIHYHQVFTILHTIEQVEAFTTLLCTQQEYIYPSSAAKVFVLPWFTVAIHSRPSSAYDMYPFVTKIKFIIWKDLTAACFLSYTWWMSFVNTDSKAYKASSQCYLVANCTVGLYMARWWRKGLNVLVWCMALLDDVVELDSMSIIASQSLYGYCLDSIGGLGISSDTTLTTTTKWSGNGEKNRVSYTSWMDAFAWKWYKTLDFQLQSPSFTHLHTPHHEQSGQGPGHH